MDDMFDDLFGIAVPVEDAAPEISDAQPLDGPIGFSKQFKISHVHELERGVTLNWLQRAFGLTRKQCEVRLRKCPVLRAGHSGTKVYDFRVACGFMTKPRMSMKQYLETIDPKDMPQQLQKEFWAARLAEQRWRKQAGDLWASEDVIALFGEVFKLIKSKTQLWSNSIDKVEALTDIQRDTLMALVDELLSLIYKSLVDLESGKATPSQIAEVDEDEEDVQQDD